MSGLVQISLQLANVCQYCNAMFKGINIALANVNPDEKEYVSVVPTSAFVGDGIGNLMAHIALFSQTTLASRLAFSEDLDCYVMEVCLYSFQFIHMCHFIGEIAARSRHNNRCYIGEWHITRRRYYHSYRYRWSYHDSDSRIAQAATIKRASC